MTVYSCPLSGLTQVVFGHFGVSLPRDSLDQLEVGEPVDEPATAGDTVVLNMCFNHNGELLGRANEVSAQVRPALRFRDAAIDNFGELMQQHLP